MNINQCFFPSLYDPPHVVEDIWGFVFGTTDSDLGLLEPRPWPETSKLITAEYQPLEFFSPPPGGAAEPWSEQADMGELFIRFKELELLCQLEDESDNSTRLSTVECEKKKQWEPEVRQSFQKKKPFVKKYK